MYFTCNVNFTLSLRRALNFLRQSTVSCLWTTDATRSLCCKLRNRKIFRNQITGRHKTKIIWRTYADPWMFQSFSCCDAFIGIHSQHLIDQVLGFRCHCIPFRWWILKKWNFICIFQFFFSVCKFGFTSKAPALIWEYSLCWSSSQNGG